MRCSAGPDSALRPGRRYGNIDQYFTLQFLYIVMNDPLRFVQTSNHQRVQSSSHTSYLAERAFIDHWIVYLEENSIYPFSRLKASQSAAYTADERGIRLIFLAALPWFA